MFRNILWGMRVPIKVQCLWRVYPAPPPVILSPQRARDGTKIWGRISIPLSGNFRTHLAIRASVWDQRRLLKLLWQEQKWGFVKWIVGINAANYQLSKVITTILEVKYGFSNITYLSSGSGCGLANYVVATDTWFEPSHQQFLIKP